MAFLALALGIGVLAVIAGVVYSIAGEESPRPGFRGKEAVETKVAARR